MICVCSSCVRQRLLLRPRIESLVRLVKSARTVLSTDAHFALVVYGRGFPQIPIVSYSGLREDTVEALKQASEYVREMPLETCVHLDPNPNEKAN